MRGTLSLALIAAVGAGAACAGKIAPSESSAGEGASDRGKTPGKAPGKAPESARSFDPESYSKACSTKADCAIVPVISECSSCCGPLECRVAMIDVH